MEKRRAGLILALWVAASTCIAQQAVTDTTVMSTNMLRVNLFAGYSSWAPHGTVEGYSFHADNAGMIFSGAYYFNRHVGAQIEGERHQQTATEGMRGFSAGPVFRVSAGRAFSLFAHGLAGRAEVTGSNQPTLSGSSFYFNPEHWGLELTTGGGVDYATPLFHHRLSLRLLQADYQYIHVDFGPAQPTTGGIANINSARLSAGIVYSIGNPAGPRR